MQDAIVIRRGRPEDALDFSKLVVLTSPKLLPLLFGFKTESIMAKIFRHRRHYYSFDRSFFVEVGGKIAGMAQLHRIKPRRREKVQLSLLLLKYLKWRFPSKISNLLKSERVIRRVFGSDCYVSNVAVYPEYRSLGLGTKLLEAVEKESKNIGKKKIVLNAETHNTRAISLYERLGYKIEHRSPTLRIGKQKFRSFKMAKTLA